MSILSIFFPGVKKQMQENSKLLEEARACNLRSTACNLVANRKLERTLQILSEFGGLTPDLQAGAHQPRRRDTRL